MLSNIEFRLSNPMAIMPTRAHDTDAGLDLYADTDYVLSKDCRTMINTGVQVRIPKGYVGLLLPRSSLSKKYIILTNSCGVIDSDYRGDIMASLMYVGDPNPDRPGAGRQVIAKHEKIVQLLIVPIELPEAIQYTGSIEDWNNTARGVGGFGSTGK
jgi:dUTP pyrophosphatase